ncbi:MAG: suppressor of fused domain protein [Planctomycetaceae bacterium]|nr:suppressor of fused domain protein [Planctomycetaceae bacterium]
MTIILRCDECEARYRVPDDRAGKRVKCKKCGMILQVPPLDDPVTSPDGTRIFRHEPRSRDLDLVSGDEQNIEAISGHIERFLGPVDMVFHELISDMVHIDIHWVKPTKKRPFHTLVTSGMSDRPMTVPDECLNLQYAELMICLPRSWKISQKAFEDEGNYWPVRLLKLLARLPHEYETWLGTGHTIPNGDPAEPYADNTRFSCALVMPPLNVPEEFHSLSLDDERDIHFYTIVPLYDEETNFKLTKGLDALMEKLEAVGANDVVDVNRANSCRRKKWFGLF